MRAIVVFFDSLNKKYLSTYGNDAMHTPNFDRLKNKSVSFNKSYVSSMPCIPARRELHTGRKNFLHREWGPIEPFDDSMPEILKKNGIYSHLISDHVHYWEEGGANYHTKYSSWEIVRGQEGDHWKGAVDEPIIPEVVKVPQNQSGTTVSSMWRYDWVNRQYIRTEEQQPMTKVFDLGVEFINKNVASDDWFLQIETFDPHEPFYVMDHYKSLYKSTDVADDIEYDWPRGRVTTETDEEINKVRDNYKALVTMCDHNLGKVLDLMDRYNLWEDTLLIVGTDHGFMLGEHNYWGKNQVPYFEEVANTPLFVYDPRVKIQGEARSELVQMIDWAPTILEHFELKIPKDMEGKPLQLVIKDNKKIRDAALYGVFSGHINVTDGEYTYMRAAKPGKENDLFNYTLMPMHMHNRFSVGELLKAEYVPGFDFMKGLNVLKVPAKDKYGVNSFGTMLFHTKEDPDQINPVDNHDIEEKMIKDMVGLMKENDAPLEQYDRVGLADYLEE